MPRSARRHIGVTGGRLYSYKSPGLGRGFRALQSFGARPALLAGRRRSRCRRRSGWRGGGRRRSCWRRRGRSTAAVVGWRRRCRRHRRRRGARRGRCSIVIRWCRGSRRSRSSDRRCRRTRVRCQGGRRMTRKDKVGNDNQCHDNNAADNPTGRVATVSLVNVLAAAVGIIIAITVRHSHD